MDALLLKLYFKFLSISAIFYSISLNFSCLSTSRTLPAAKVAAFAFQLDVFRQQQFSCIFLMPPPRGH